MPLLRCEIRLWGRGRRSILRRLFRLLGLVVLGLLAPFVFYAVAALTGAVIPRQTADVDQSASSVEIILAQGVIHYDILIPLDDEARSVFGFAEEAGVPLTDPAAEWLSLGWGSKAFYTQTGTYGDISLGTTWRAAAGDSGAIRIEVYGPLPDHPKLRRVTVSPEQLAALRSAIRRDMTLEPVPLDVEGFSDTDAFYPADGRFNMFRTCNVWVGEVMAQAGLPMGVWTPTPFAVTLSLWWNGHLAD